MKALLRHVFFFFFCWSNKNEMSFGINKYVTMVIKPFNFVSYHGYEETYISSWYFILKESMYIYLGIPFSNDLSFEPIITYMNTKVRKSLIFFCYFFNSLIKFH